MFKKNITTETVEVEVEMKEILSLSIYDDANNVGIDMLRCLAHRAIESYENYRWKDDKTLEKDVEDELREFAFSLNYIYHSFESINKITALTKSWKIDLDKNYYIPKLIISADVDSLFYDFWMDNSWMEEDVEEKEEMSPTEGEEIVDTTILDDSI